MKNESGRMYRQSAVVPYFWHEGEIHIVLITSVNSGQWGIPKGMIEPYLTPSESAAKEAEEEAGAIGTLDSNKICEYTYHKWCGTCHVQVFSLHVTELQETWDESCVRNRTTVPLNNAIEMVKPVLVEVLEKFEEYIENKCA